MRKDEFAPPPPAADEDDGPRRHRHPARGAGEDAQRRRPLSLPARQRFLLPHRLRRARGGRGADSGPRRRPNTCCSCATAIRRARPGTAAAPARKARCATTAPTTRFPINDIDDILPGLMEHCSRVYYTMGLHQEFDQRVIGWVNGLKTQARTGVQPPQEFVALDHLLHDMRLFKSRPELDAMRRVGADRRRGAQARDALRAARPHGIRGDGGAAARVPPQQRRHLLPPHRRRRRERLHPALPRELRRRSPTATCC